MLTVWDSSHSYISHLTSHISANRKIILYGRYLSPGPTGWKSFRRSENDLFDNSELWASFNCQFGGGKGKLISSVISHFVRTNDKSADTHRVELTEWSSLRFSPSGGQRDNIYWGKIFKWQSLIRRSNMSWVSSDICFLHLAPQYYLSLLTSHVGQTGKKLTFHSPV